MTQPNTVKRIDESQTLRDHELGGLLIREGRLWKTDCTCAKRQPARAVHCGRWISVCANCGSTRQGTGT